MSPDPVFYQAMLDDQGLSMSPERVAAAVEAHTSMRGGLDALRAVPLSYLDPVVEPDSALTWIETAGTETGGNGTAGTGGVS